MDSQGGVPSRGHLGTRTVSEDPGPGAGLTGPRRNPRCLRDLSARTSRCNVWGVLLLLLYSCRRLPPTMGQRALTLRAMCSGRSIGRPRRSITSWKRPGFRRNSRCFLVCVMCSLLVVTSACNCLGPGTAVSEALLGRGPFSLGCLRLLSHRLGTLRRGHGDHVAHQLKTFTIGPFGKVLANSRARSKCLPGKMSVPVTLVRFQGRTTVFTLLRQRILESLKLAEVRSPSALSVEESCRGNLVCLDIHLCSQQSGWRVSLSFLRKTEHPQGKKGSLTKRVNSIWGQ